MALKNSSSSAGFEPANLGFDGKHDNHQTTGKYKKTPYSARYIKYT
jgi:hypothetical protein